jgi:nitronate monooxygenase
VSIPSTPLSRRLGLRYPLVSAPMFLISNREMLVAAAEAGILGSMPTLNARTSEQLDADLEWVRQRTDRPFALNLTIGLTPAERIASDMEVCEKWRVPCLITSYGDPTELVRRAHGWGAVVMHDVIHLKHALKAERAGVDAIIAVSSGAGGHAGTVSPFVLVPWLAGELKVPLVAAGCIHGGAQVAASLALGAELCYLGTRFIASAECGAQPEYKQMVVDASPDDIVYTDQVSGVHANFFKKTVPVMDPTRPKDGSAAKRWRDIWSAGQGAALVREVKPMGDIVAEIVAEFEVAARRLTG